MNKAFLAGCTTSDLSKKILLKKRLTAETKVLTISEQNLFEKYYHENKYYFYLLLLYTALRPFELIKLKSNHINLLEEYVLVATSKTKNGIRKVPLTKKALQVLDQFDLSLPYLFNNGQPFNYNKTFSTIAKNLGIVDVIPYSLRHTFATRCAENNIAPKILQKWLGHADILVTLRYYTHITDDYEKFNIEQIHNLF